MSWDKYFEVVGLILLASPLVWEVTNDKDGDAHISRAKVFEPYQLLSKKVDVIARVCFTLAAALFNYLVNDVPFLKSVFLAAGLHFFFFDYIIAYVLITRGIIDDRFNHWFTYLGSKGLDNFYYWKTMDPVARLVIRVLVLALSLTIYFYER